MDQITRVMDTTSPRGNPVRLHHRDGTSDLSVIFSTFSAWGGPPEDEYGLADIYVSGLALDIGAHVGSVAIALLADNPDLRVIAVEPLPDNCAVIRASLAENGFTGRCQVINAAFGSGEIAFGYSGTEIGETNRFIGNLSHMADDAETYETVSVPVVTLSEIAPEGAALAKLDCEACEWSALDDPAVAGLERIIGEAHSGDWPKRLRQLIGKTHKVTVRHDGGGVGLFDAVRR